MHHALDKRFIFLLIAEYVYMTTFKAETSISRPIPFPPDREIGMMIATFAFSISRCIIHAAEYGLKECVRKIWACVTSIKVCVCEIHR